MVLFWGLLVPSCRSTPYSVVPLRKLDSLSSPFFEQRIHIMNSLIKAIPLFRDMSMMELIFLATYAVMGVWGVAVMVSGYLHLNNEYIVRDLKARLLSLLLLAPFPVAFVLKSIARSAMDKQAYLSTWFMYDMVTLTLCGLTFIGLGIYLSPPDGGPQMATKGEKRSAAQKRGKK